jgi:hypothetical protein
MSRTLTITLQRQGMPANLGVAPVARGYGTHVIPLPADRPVEFTC